MLSRIPSRFDGLRQNIDRCGVVVHKAYLARHQCVLSCTSPALLWDCEEFGPQCKKHGHRVLLAKVEVSKAHMV